MNTHIARVTGQDKFNPNRFSTLYRGCRYDIDLKTGSVWGYEVNSNGSRTVTCHKDEVINAVKLAVIR